jgi:hypothetical protein
LVAEPTAKELDAALADVRVRAVPIARRRARNRQAVTFIGLLLIGGAGAAVGRMSVTTAAWDSEYDGRAAGQPKVIVEGGAHPVVVAGSTLRWHVTSWDELQGYQWNKADAWIEGPEGTGFELTVTSLGAALHGSYRPMLLGGDSQMVTLGGTVSHRLGITRDGFSVKAEGQLWQNEATVRGATIVVFPFGTKGEMLTTVRFDGPYAEAPDDPVRWQAADTMDASEWIASRRRHGVAQGVRYAVNNLGALSVQPFFQIVPPRVRVSLPGRPEGVELQFQEYSRAAFLLPGMADSLWMSFGTLPTSKPGEWCVFVHDSRNDPGRRGGGCFAAEQTGPLSVQLRERLQLTIERLATRGTTRTGEAVKR